MKVVNASLGSTYPSQAEYDAIAAHPDTLYVISAGNDNTNADNAYPCALGLANIVCVGATDSSDQRATFSNYSPTSVDLSAPGVNIISAYHLPASPYMYMNGTSMAAPHVADGGAVRGDQRAGRGEVRSAWSAATVLVV